MNSEKESMKFQQMNRYAFFAAQAPDPTRSRLFWLLMVLPIQEIFKEVTP
jgi:hypothetical protein